MSVKDSHLTIREDLIEQSVSVPVWFLDYKEDTHVEDSPTLNIDCDYSTDGEELNPWGANIIVKITDPNQVDKYGNPWKERLAFAISADFDWN